MAQLCILSRGSDVPLVYDHDPSGLLVARESASEEAVRRALKQLDSRLMLDYMIDTEWQRTVWQVLCRVSADQPPAVVCRWRGVDGEPLPLSHGLVEKVRGLHMDSRAPRVDADAENQRLRDRIDADADAELEEIARELVPRLQGKKSSVLPRGLHRRGTAFADVTDIR